MQNRNSSHGLVKAVGLLVALVIGGAVARAGLVAGWHFDEGSGTNAIDASGYGNHGTLVNMNTGSCWVAGRLNGALDFNGSGNYVSIPNNSSLQITGDVTLAMWFKPSIMASQRVISKKYSSCEYSVMAGSQGALYFYHGNPTGDLWRGTVIPSGKIMTNVWQHIAVVRDTSTREVKGYLNGVHMGTAVYPTDADKQPTATTYPVVIGGPYGEFDGLIDEVVIIDGVTSEEEIATLADPELRLRMDFDEGAETVAYDYSLYGNHGTLVNMGDAPWTTGHINMDGYFRSALDFEGSDNYVSCANDSTLQITNDLTLAAWINPSSMACQRVVSKKWFNCEYAIMVGNNGALYFYHGNPTGNVWCGTAIPDFQIVINEWQHIAVTRDSATREVKGYLNGVHMGTAVYPTDADKQPTATTYPVVIGGPYGEFNGDIDNVLIYARVLSSNEIAAMQFNLLTAYTLRNYYTGDSAVAVCELAMPADEMNGCHLIVTNAQGNILGTNTTLENGTDLPFSIAAMSTGSTAVTVALRRDTGERVFAQNISILKRAPSSVSAIAVDRRNGMLLRDGQPFFPIGFCMSDIASCDTNDFQIVTAAGFNSVINWLAGVDPADAAAYLDNAAACGLQVILNLDEYFPDIYDNYFTTNFWGDYVQKRDRLTNAVGYAKLKNNLIGYKYFDEPGTNQYQAGQDLYGRINSADGYHPCFVLYNATVPAGSNAVNWCDVLGVDAYFIPPRVADNNFYSSVDRVTRCTRMTRARAWQDYKGCWLVPMAEFSSSCYKRAILPAEQRTQTYLALIHGAKGIFYFFYPIFHDDLGGMLLNLAGEVSELAPSLLTPDMEQQVAYSTGPFDPEQYLFSDVQVCLRQAPAGTNYDYVLLAANTREYPVDATYTISRLGSDGAVGRLFGAETYGVTNGSFSEQLPVLATRAYTFSSTSTVPVIITVNLTARLDLAPTAEAEPYPYSGRPGKTNLMQNPSLEDASLANWPDYCKPWNANPRINSANQGWGQESSDPYHSNRCLKIDNGPAVNGFYFTLAPQHDNANGLDYTFSVYLKSDQAGYAVRLGCSAVGYTTVTTSVAWVRYQYTCTIPKDVNPSTIFWVMIPYATGTVWADAVQVEEGSSATEFTMD